MKTRTLKLSTFWGWLLLSVINLALLFSNTLLLSSLKALRSANDDNEKRLQKAASLLQAETARVLAKDATIKELRSQLERERDEHDREKKQLETHQHNEKDEGTEAAAFIEDLTARPDIASIPLLSPEEMDLLREQSDKLPRELDPRVLVNEDLDGVLADPIWNPTQRTLSPEERVEAARLIADYKYFATVSPRERVTNYILPEVEDLRVAGAFVEYDASGPPPGIDGVSISHAERSETSGYKRVYYFFEEDYPDLYHHQRVEQQRAPEAIVRIYDLIRGR